MRHDAAERDGGSRGDGVPLLVVVLLLTTACVLAWSHAKLLNQDEMFVLQTDGVASLREVVRIQRHWPISLDPLVYHAIAHGMTRVFGVGAFALRLPSLLGYLLMQVCLFVYVRRSVGGAAGARAGAVAAAFPALTQTLFYAAEARPYGLLLGLYALTLVAWQAATREAGSRRWALPVLAGAIALTLNAHYFGILLLLPVYAAELVRTLDRRRADIGVWTAILLGTAAIVFTLPFSKAAGEFRKHYYNAGGVSVRAVTQAYRSLFVDYTRTSLRTQHDAAILFVLLAATFVAALILRRRALGLPRAEAVFLGVLAALPIAGYLLAKFVTHSIEVRYVLGAIVGITALLAVLSAPLLRRNATYGAVVALLMLAIAGANMVRIHGEQQRTEATLAGLAVSPALREALLADPSQHLYMQQMGHYELAQYYVADPLLRERLTLVYSAPLEIRIDGHDTEALTAEHLQHFSGLPIVSYESLRSTPRPHLFVLYRSGWDWTDQAFAEDRIRVAPVAVWDEGTVAQVQ